MQSKVFWGNYSSSTLRYLYDYMILPVALPYLHDCALACCPALPARLCCCLLPCSTCTTMVFPAALLYLRDYALTCFLPCLHDYGLACFLAYLHDYALACYILLFNPELCLIVPCNILPILP